MSRHRQELPPAECELLRTLTGPDLKFRARLLSEEGWSLASIANAFNPPRQRSSVRAWVTARVPVPPTAHTLPPIPSSSSAASTSPIAAAENSHLSSSHAHAHARARRPRRTYDPAAPVLSPAERSRAAELAPLARRYRARMTPSGSYARANRELTELCRRLYHRGASVRELSLAAGVTYRAMSRRIGR